MLSSPKPLGQSDSNFIGMLQVGDKYATGVPTIKKIRGKENIAVGTWNVRTLRPAGKLEKLTHAISR